MAKDNQQDLNNVSKVAEQAKEATRAVKDLDKAQENAGESAKDLDKDYKALATRLYDISGKGLSIVGKAFTSVISVVSSAIESNREYFKTLNQIVGINGQLGQLGQALRNATSGVVGKQDLAEFFVETSDIIRGADAMLSQVEYARDLIAAYGSVQVAAQKYRNILLLSVEDQRTAMELVKRQAEIVENSSSGIIESIQTQASEAMSSVGQSILYTLSPIIDFIGEVAQAFRELSGLQAIDDQTAALEQNLKLSEEELRVQKELDEIERLNSSGFLSSLDEVHEAGNLLVEAIGGEDAESEADKVISAEKEKQDELSKTSARAREVAEAFMLVFDIVKEVGSLFSEIFTAIGPELLNLLSFITQIVSSFISWLKETNLLKPALIGLISVITALSAAHAVLAIAKIASSGPAALVTAGIVASAVGIGTGVLAGIGLNVGSGSSTSSSVPENSYSGTAQETTQSQINVYLDGKKVNDALATETIYNEEVLLIT